MKKYVNGQYIEMTPEEIAKHEEIAAMISDAVNNQKMKEIEEEAKRLENSNS